VVFEGDSSSSRSGTSVASADLQQNIFSVVRTIQRRLAPRMRPCWRQSVLHTSNYTAKQQTLSEYRRNSAAEVRTDIPNQFAR